LSSHLQDQLLVLAGPQRGALLRSIRRGIEKEGLRVGADGRVAQSPHPAGLGSALTHSSITTDYSEALLELITPVSQSIEQSLETLENIHSFVYQQLDGEMLWAASMPCIVAGEASIPVARYGSSNVARMKTVYRYGLGHRYGRMMQAIAGIHYNFSMPGEYWEPAWKRAGSPGGITDFTSTRYLDLIRNFRRYSWLLIYLFGASPAVCSSFLGGRDNHGLEPFDPRGRSLYLPYGTALRMGDLGYNSEAQKTLNVCYNSLDSYIDTLRSAILLTHPPYREISSGADGDYQQLNDSLLQIENEFYSPIRPKRVVSSGEAPLRALRRGGIEYVEVRCVDVSPFTAVGLDAAQVRFMDTFLLYCLLEESPPCDDGEHTIQAANLEAVVNRGRLPGLQLLTSAGERDLAQWAGELLAAMQPVAEQLDLAFGVSDYMHSLQRQREKVEQPELTPSARVLREMRQQDLPFFRLALAYSERWAGYFRARSLPPDIQACFEQEAARSLQAQKAIEESDAVSFEQYLKDFFDQYREL